MKQEWERVKAETQDGCVIDSKDVNDQADRKFYNELFVEIRKNLNCYNYNSENLRNYIKSHEAYIIKEFLYSFTGMNIKFADITLPILNDYVEEIKNIGK